MRKISVFLTALLLSIPTLAFAQSGSTGTVDSPFDGTWTGSMNDLPGVTFIIADAGGGQIGGVVTFFFHLRGDDGKWRVAGKFVAPLLAPQSNGKVLAFEVQHHKSHGSPEFGPNVRFRIELEKNNQALLYNVSEEQSEPVRLTRQ